MAVSKRVVMGGAVVGMTVGGFVPFLWGDDNFFDLPSLLLTMVGGFFGIWAAYQISKRFDF